MFGDIKSFRSQFSRLETDGDFKSLRERLKPICQRTLRRQVLEYIPFTNRIALVEEFIPSEPEQKLYNLVSDYLQRQNLYALPASQRQLMTLILRRLLASSTFAIAGTLKGLADKLEKAADAQKPVIEPPQEVAETFESFEELEDEWEEEEDESETDKKSDPRVLSPDQLEQVAEEIKSLRLFTELANSIAKNSKGERLQTALKRGLAEAKSKGGREKAIIFTESTRTQEYVRSILEEIHRYSGKVVLFNGSNNDPKSKEIYQNWLKKHEGTDYITGSKTADMRAALVEYFRDEAIIMIATEAAAEGINLQFCSLVINYDLPWNPQRIEQRIGRCHRYGQKHDVVVVNFLNKKNAADQRVYQLLDEKFKLFSGVFGASDEVLGSIGSGIDFEKRIGDIYQKCRTEEQIQFNFDQLQQEMEIQIDERIKQTRQKLLENFDEEVHEKLRINDRESNEVKSKFDHWLWELTRFYLQPYAKFEDGRTRIHAHQESFSRRADSSRPVSERERTSRTPTCIAWVIRSLRRSSSNAKRSRPTRRRSHSITLIRARKSRYLSRWSGRAGSCVWSARASRRSKPRISFSWAAFVTMALRLMPNSAADSFPLALWNSRRRAPPYLNIFVRKSKNGCGFSRTKPPQS